MSWHVEEHESDDPSDQENEEGGLLRLDNLYKSGKLKRDLASHVQVDEADTHTVKVRARCLTCVAVTKDDSSAFMGDKSGVVYRYDMQGQKLQTIKAEGLAAINAISCNDVNTLFATGHEDWSVKVWDSRTCKVIGGVSDRYGHRGPVYGLCFKKGKQESILMTASRDRTVKMWSAEERVYIRTLYGHRSSVLAVDALAAERAVSVSDDKQPRMWKIDVDSTLGYGVSRHCLEGVAMLSETHFLTVGTGGRIALYNRDRQNPIAFQDAAHGCFLEPPAGDAAFAPSFGSYMERSLAQRQGLALREAEGPGAGAKAGEGGGAAWEGANGVAHAAEGDEADAAEGEEGAAALPPGAGQANWVHSVAAVPNADLFATGSCDGAVRLWKADTDAPAIEPVLQVPAPGWVNGLAFTHAAGHVVACCGPHHRLGRWFTAAGKGARNQLVVTRLPYDIDIEDLTQFAAAKALPELPLPPDRVQKEKPRPSIWKRPLKKPLKRKRALAAV